jgi:hypothetical protein
MTDALKAKRILVVEADYLIAPDIKSAVEQRAGAISGPALRLTKYFDSPALTDPLADMAPGKG